MALLAGSQNGSLGLLTCHESDRYAGRLSIACSVGAATAQRLVLSRPSRGLSRPPQPSQYPESGTLARAGDASSKKLGTYLVMSQFQGSVNSSAMFLTAAAQNLLCMKLAAELGVIIASPWLTWFKVRDSTDSSVIDCGPTGLRWVRSLPWGPNPDVRCTLLQP